MISAKHMIELLDRRSVMKMIQGNIKNEIVNTNGRFFHIMWVKKNGDVRTALAQTKVKKGLKGIGRNWEDADNQVTVYEKLTGERIVITTDKVIEFRCGKVVIKA